MSQELTEYRRPEFTFHGQPFPMDLEELYEWLKPVRNYSTWRKYHMGKFVAGEDFRTSVCKSTGGRPSVQVFVSERMAHHVAMVSSTAAGRMVRDWFIQRDRKLTAVESQTPALPSTAEGIMALASDPVKALEMFTSLSGSLVSTMRENQALTPKAEAFDHFIAKDDAYNVEQAANLLNIGPGELWDVMKDKKHIYRRNTYGKSAQYIPRQDIKRAGYLTYKETPFTNDDGRTFHNTKVFITGRGLEWYRKNLRKFGLIEAPQRKAVN